MNKRTLIFLACIYLGLGVAFLQTYNEWKAIIDVFLIVLNIVAAGISIWDYFNKKKYREFSLHIIFNFFSNNCRSN